MKKIGGIVAIALLLAGCAATQEKPETTSEVSDPIVFCEAFDAGMEGYASYLASLGSSITLGDDFYTQEQYIESMYAVANNDVSKMLADYGSPLTQLKSISNGGTGSFDKSKFISAVPQILEYCVDAGYKRGE